MKLYLTRRWGNILDGENGPDVYCLVCALDHKEAARLGDAALENGDQKGYSRQVFELGETKEVSSKLLMGPFLSSTFNFSQWVEWHRETQLGRWHKRIEQ